VSISVLTPIHIQTDKGKKMAKQKVYVKSLMGKGSITIKGIGVDPINLVGEKQDHTFRSIEEYEPYSGAVGALSAARMVDFKILEPGEDCCVDAANRMEDLEKEKADKEAAEKARIEKEKADKEAAEKDNSPVDPSEKGLLEDETSEETPPADEDPSGEELKAQAEKEAAEKEKADKKAKAKKKKADAKKSKSNKGK
jgi:hypothetical protein